MNENENNKQLLNKPVSLRNPSQMDTYVHVTSPRTWLIAVALFLVMAALAFWGFFGRIPQYHETIGVGVDDATSALLNDESIDFVEYVDKDEKVSMILCLVEPNLFSLKQLDKKKANVFFRDGTTVQGVTQLTTGAPQSQVEIEKELDYWLVDEDWVISNLDLEKSKYWYLVKVDLDEDVPNMYWGAICDVEIVTDEDTPISFLFKQES